MIHSRGPFLILAMSFEKLERRFGRIDIHPTQVTLLMSSAPRFSLYDLSLSLQKYWGKREGQSFLPSRPKQKVGSDLRTQN